MTGLTRDEHLAYCKRRAHEYLAIGDVQNAVQSMMSDLQKHEATRNVAPELLALGFTVMLERDVGLARKYIDGFR
jgi:hypothetical protein